MSQLTDVPVFDRAKALALVDGHLCLLVELAEMFLHEQGKLLALVQQAVARRDPRSIERAAHGLRGAIAYFGTTRSLHSAILLEQMAMSGDLKGVDHLQRTLWMHLNQLADALRQLVSETTYHERRST